MLHRFLTPHQQSFIPLPKGRKILTSPLPQGGDGGGSAVSVYKRIPRNPILITRARDARKNPTEPEKRLWHALKTWQLQKHKFRRQEIIGNYIVDYACYKKHLILEIDGESHAFSSDYDARRTAYLKKLGLRVLRFWNNEVMENFDGVLQRIAEELNRSDPPPNLLPEGGGVTTSDKL